MAMYFVQHGLSLSKEINPDRPLSEEGRNEVKRISAHLQKMGIRVNKVFHSGKTRARETAQIFSDQIGGGNVYELRGMSPNEDVTEFAETLKEDNTMYVGHLPHMEKLVSYLVTGDEKTGVVKFANGGVVCVGKSEAGVHIEWYMIPTMCIKG
jgi:phosphohistidine phosphatase